MFGDKAELFCSSLLHLPGGTFMLLSGVLRLITMSMGFGQRQVPTTDILTGYREAGASAIEQFRLDNSNGSATKLLEWGWTLFFLCERHSVCVWSPQLSPSVLEFPLGRESCLLAITRDAHLGLIPWYLQVTPQPTNQSCSLSNHRKWLSLW